MILRGRAWKFGDNVDTDVIIPARHCNIQDEKELAKHCMEDIDPEFTKKIKPGDIIVGGANFGCGSSREQAPLSIKGAGVSCVLGRSFARIFFRNSINIGLPIFECREAADSISQGDEIEVDTSSGRITNLTKSGSFSAPSLPEFVGKIVSLGGLMPYVKERMKERGGKG